MPAPNLLSQAQPDPGPPGAPDALPNPASPQEKRAEAATVVLYLVFFLLWCGGYALGVLETGTSMLFGLPVWFAISCLFAFAAVCVLLYLAIKRYFQ